MTMVTENDRGHQKWLRSTKDDLGHHQISLTALTWMITVMFVAAGLTFVDLRPWSFCTEKKFSNMMNLQECDTAWIFGNYQKVLVYIL